MSSYCNLRYIAEYPIFYAMILIEKCQTGKQIYRKLHILMDFSYPCEVDTSNKNYIKLTTNFKFNIKTFCYSRFRIDWLECRLYLFDFVQFSLLSFVDCPCRKANKRNSKKSHHTIYLADLSDIWVQTHIFVPEMLSILRTLTLAVAACLLISCW